MTEDIVRVVGLERLVRSRRRSIVMRQVIGKSEFAKRVAGSRELRNDFFKIGNCACEAVVHIALNQGAVVESARIAGSKRERLVRSGSCRFVVFQVELGRSNVGVAIGVVGTESDDVLEGVKSVAVLTLIDQGDSRSCSSGAILEAGRWKLLREAGVRPEMPPDSQAESP